MSWSYGKAVCAGLMIFFFALETNAAQCTDVFQADDGINENLPDDRKLTFDTDDWKDDPVAPDVRTEWPASGTELSSGDYYFKEDKLDGNYSLTVAPDATVRIFVDGDMKFEDTAALNSSGTPDQLQLFVDGKIDVKDDAIIRGRVYATDKLKVEGDALIEGLTLVDGKIDVKDNAIIRGVVYATDKLKVEDDALIEGETGSEKKTETKDNGTVNVDNSAVNQRLLSGLCETPGAVTLPVVDTFESYSPGSINGLAGGTGWGGPWSGQAGQTLVDTSADPLEFVDLQGRRIRSATTLEIVGNNNEVASRPLDGTFSGDTLFLSMLVRFTGNPTNNDFVALWIERPMFGDSPQFGLKMNKGNGSGTEDFFVRMDQAADYSTDLAVGETYLLVAQYSKGSDNFFNNAKLWVNPECEATPPAVPSAERNLPPANRVSEVSAVGFRSVNLSGSDAFEIGQVAVGAQWTDVVRCSPGPLVEYRMEQTDIDGTAGEVLDTSGNNNHATSFGGMGTANVDPAIAGNPGTCRYGDFDGSNDRITDANAGNYLNGLEAVTVMAWVYNSAPLDDNDRGIFFTDNSAGKDNRLGLRYDTRGAFGRENNVIKASVLTDECNPSQECLQVETDGGQLVRDDWQHVAMTWTTDGEIKVYVDGSAVGTSGTRGNGGTGALAGIDRLEIGLSAKNNQRWQGRIDEFKVFGVALTEAEIMAEMNRAFPCAAIGPDHIRLTHPGQGLTCSPAEVTVEACANDDCSVLFGESVDVSFTSPADAWVPNPVTVSGQTDVQLSVTQPTTVTLGASVSPSAQNPSRCFSGGTGTETCELTFLDSGFVIDVPDHISDTLVNGTIAAVRKDEVTGRCVPGFANESKDVSVWSEYNNPSNGTLLVSIDGTSVATVSPGTPRNLNFDGDGVASVDVRYPDVGRIALNARHEGSGESEGLMMTGNGSFITRPAYFTLDIPDNPEAAVVADDNDFVAAGEDFPITVSSRNASDAITPNFGQESAPEDVSLTVSLVAPAGGRLPPLSGAFGDFAQDCENNPAQGGTACSNFNWPEVGIIGITPMLASGAYLGSENVTGNAVSNVGRFVPADFDFQIVDAGSVAPYCTAISSFAYFGQDLAWLSGAEPLLEVRALAVGGTLTENYTEPGFLRLESSGVERLAAVADGAKVGTQSDPLPVTVTLETMARSLISSGVMRFTFNDTDALRYLKEPTSRVAPFDPDYSIALEGVRDQDDVTSTQPTLTLKPDFAFQIRYGRLFLENAYGPETMDLRVPFEAQIWNGSRFERHTDENCWTYDTADAVITDTPPSTSVDAKTGTLVGGAPASGSELVLSAPGEGNTGSVQVRYPVPGYWQDDFNGDGSMNDPTATATFGVYRGNDRVIYWQER